MPLKRNRQQQAPRLERALLLLAVTLGSSLSTLAVVRWFTHRIALLLVWGPWAWVLLAGLLLSALLSAVALAHRIRAERGRRRSAPSTPPSWSADLFSLLVLSATLYVACVPSFATLSFQFGLGLCSGLFAIRVLAGPRPLPRAASPLLFSACFLLVLGEVGLRVYGTIWPTPLLTPAQGDVVEHIDAHRLPAGSMRWGFPSNSSGHYDSEFLIRQQRDGPTVVALGDSFSTGVVPHPLHFTTVSERLMGSVQVYNLGVGATGPVHYEHLLQTEVLPLEPDAIVLNLFVGNDITRHLEGSPGGLREWFERDHLRLLLLPQRLMTLWQEGRDAGGGPSSDMLSDIATPQGEGQGAGDRRAGSDRNGQESIESLSTHFPWLNDPSREKQTFSRQQYLEVEVRRALRVCDRSIEGYPKLLSVLDRMATLAGETPFAIALIPDEFQVEDSLWNSITAQSSLDLDRDRPQRLLLTALKQRGIPVLDLLPLLRAMPAQADGSRHLYHLRDTHFNARGNQLAGEAYASFLPTLLR